jgi:hypothetical protein
MVVLSAIERLPEVGIKLLEAYKMLSYYSSCESGLDK